MAPSENIENDFMERATSHKGFAIIVTIRSAWTHDASVASEAVNSKASPTTPLPLQTIPRASTRAAFWSGLYEADSVAAVSRASQEQRADSVDRCAPDPNVES